jgi:hypothetical protein
LRVTGFLCETKSRALFSVVIGLPIEPARITVSVADGELELADGVLIVAVGLVSVAETEPPAEDGEVVVADGEVQSEIVQPAKSPLLSNFSNAMSLPPAP